MTAYLTTHVDAALAKVAKSHASATNKVASITNSFLPLAFLSALAGVGQSEFQRKLDAAYAPDTAPNVGHGYQIAKKIATHSAGTVRALAFKDAMDAAEMIIAEHREAASAAGVPGSWPMWSKVASIPAVDLKPEHWDAIADASAKSKKDTADKREHDKAILAAARAGANPSAPAPEAVTVSDEQLEKAAFAFVEHAKDRDALDRLITAAMARLATLPIQMQDAA